MLSPCGRALIGLLLLCVSSLLALGCFCVRKAPEGNSSSSIRSSVCPIGEREPMWQCTRWRMCSTVAGDAGCPLTLGARPCHVPPRIVWSLRFKPLTLPARVWEIFPKGSGKLHLGAAPRPGVVSKGRTCGWSAACVPPSGIGLQHLTAVGLSCGVPGHGADGTQAWTHDLPRASCLRWMCPSCFSVMESGSVAFSIVLLRLACCSVWTAREACIV